MIRSLRLSNWRNYEDLVIDFTPGTTFVVASNGVGKTSLVEAARFGLFGVLPPRTSSPVRVGGSEAGVGVTLELPDGRQITVERTLAVNRGRHVASVTVRLDGEVRSDAALVETIRAVYGTDASFLARLVMPAATREEDRPTALGLEAHLGTYFGVQKLQHASRVLAERLNQTLKQIQSIKSAHAATAQQLATLEAEVERTAVAAGTATADHEVASETLDRARAVRRAVEVHSAWMVKHRQVEVDREVLLREIAENLAMHDDAARDVASLATRISELDRDIEDARHQRAVREAQTSMIAASQTRLDEAHDDCPVCRRPLDDATVANAHRSNEADLATLTREAAEFRRREIAAVSARERLRDLQQRWSGLRDAGPEPEVPEAGGSETASVDAAAAQLSAAVDRMVSARAAQLEANRRLQEARDADQAMRELERLFRVEAELRIAHDTTNATLAELLQETVRPLAAAVNERWTALFPDRGQLSTGPDGTMSRHVNGHDLPYDAFSTGESIGATIVLRLLVAQMATTVDFCWFDEPLEHLDPDVRRRVANILSRASAGDGGLNQIVVTTYEEPLARALTARHPERVHLVDVRQASVLSNN